MLFTRHLNLGRCTGNTIFTAHSPLKMLYKGFVKTDYTKQHLVHTRLNKLRQKYPFDTINRKMAGGLKPDVMSTNHFFLSSLSFMIYVMSAHYLFSKGDGYTFKGQFCQTSFYPFGSKMFLAPLETIIFLLD